MERGIDQILGKIPFPTYLTPEPCIHESDGHDYEGILRCELCGIHYECQH